MESIVSFGSCGAWIGSRGSWTLECGLSTCDTGCQFPGNMWDFPRPGIRDWTISGRFLTTRLPWTFPIFILKWTFIRLNIADCITKIMERIDTEGYLKSLQQLGMHSKIGIVYWGNILKNNMTESIKGKLHKSI